MEDNDIKFFSGPEVFIIEGIIDKKVFEEFKAAYNRFLSGESSGIRIYLKSINGHMDYIKIMTDMINIGRFSISIVAVGYVGNNALYLLMNTTCVSSHLPGTFGTISRLAHPSNFDALHDNIKVSGDLEYEMFSYNALIKKLKLPSNLRTQVLDGLNVEPIIINHKVFNKIMEERSKYDPTQEEINKVMSGESFTDDELLKLENRVIDMGFLDDEADMSDKEFASYLIGSYYGPYSKEDLIEFKNILIQKGLYNRIKLVDNLINKSK